eukprot:2844835-Rhodomonas_salina.1
MTALSAMGRMLGFVLANLSTGSTSENIREGVTGMALWDVIAEPALRRRAVTTDCKQSDPALSG